MSEDVKYVFVGGPLDGQTRSAPRFEPNAHRVGCCEAERLPDGQAVIHHYALVGGTNTFAFESTEPLQVTS